MRIQRRSIGDFVPGSFPVPTTPSGIGDFVPGWFALPQNPIRNGGMGFVRASFALPEQSPFAGMGALGCDCGGTCGGCGMGDIDFSLTSTSIADSLGVQAGTVPNWLLYTGAAGLAFLVFDSQKKGRRR